MLLYHIDVKITRIDSKRLVHEASYDANAEHTHRLLFAVDPLEAAHFSADENLGHNPTPKPQRKEPHP